ncbi:kinetochore scaffold 1 isoform X2 [Hemicordylus capensis]|uniref:kinetochore scaffold 1 isoform X2 n=1 Tax=Hemicordylus capensis TaxID=884348 RepID=UPI002302AF6C|nr:kinetochore scaffold 1 isoform X2 [Hemicordylus capensis]
MDRIYSEANEENDYTDCTIKRRISSILKAPRSPLRDIGNGNELTQDCNIEKRQKNSRRVSFADTIRVFPPDLQNTVESNHAENAADVKDQDPLYQNEEPEVVPCEITGMNTLLHAPIQTPLQQMECHDANTGQEWNKMDRTCLFSEENEMDMTVGHMVMITHDIGISHTDNKPRKIDFKSFAFSKEVSEVNKEFSFFSSSAKVNETSVSQQKTNTQNTQKINCDYFLKSLKSTKVLPINLVPTMVPERNVCSSAEDAYTHSQGKNRNITTVFDGLDSRMDVTEYCVSNKNVTSPHTWHPLKPSGCGEVTLACGDESMDLTVANTEIILLPGTSSFKKVNQQEHLKRDGSVTCRTDSCRLNTSSYQSGVQQDPHMCIVNNNADVAAKHADKMTSRDASLAFNQGNRTIPFGPATSVPVLHGDRTTVFSSFCADMEMTSSCSGLIWDGNSKHTSNLPYGTSEKQRSSVARLVEGTVSGESNMAITKNQASTNSYLNSVQHSFPYNEIAASNRESANMELLNPRINPGSWDSCLHERKESSLLVSLPSKRSAVSSSKNIDLNRSSVATSTRKHAENHFLPVSSDMTVFEQVNHTTAEDSKTNVKSGVSDNATSFIPANKTIMFTCSEDMEITKPTAYFRDLSINTAEFHDVPQHEMRASKKSVTDLASGETVLFSQREDNEMEITKSCTVAVSHDIIQQAKVATQELLNPRIGPDSWDSYLPERKENSLFVSLPSKRSAVSSSKNIDLNTSLVATSARKHAENQFLPISSDMTVFEQVNHTTAEDSKTCVKSGVSDNATSFIPADKTIMLTCSEDMEITKPTTYFRDLFVHTAEFHDVPQHEMRASKKSVTDLASGETVLFSQREDNEMEITKSCTVAVSHDIIQQAKVATQELFSDPADKTGVSVQSSDTPVTKSTTCFPLDKTVMFVHNNEIEISKPITDRFLKNTNFRALSQKGKEAREAVLPGTAKGDTINLAPPENEMEITKSHTVAVDHGIASQYERTSQVPFGWEDMDIAGFLAVDKNSKINMPKSVVKLGKQAEWEPSSNQNFETLADIETTKSYSMPFDSKAVLHNQSASQSGSGFSLSKIHAFASCQNGAEVTDLPLNTTGNGSLKGSEKQEMPSKNTQQNLDNMPSLPCRAEKQDIEIARNQTITIHGSNNFLLTSEKQILNSSMKSREKMISLLDEDNMEMTRNYTTGIEFMHTNDLKNECYLLSQAKSGSVVPYETKLGSAETDKSIPEKSVCSANVMFSIPLNIVQEQQKYLKMKEKQLESCTSSIGNLVKEIASNVSCREENKLVLTSPQSAETGLDLNTGRMITESKKNDPRKLSQSRQEDNQSRGTEGLPVDNKVTKNCETVPCEWGSITKDRQTNFNFLSKEDHVFLPRISASVSDCSKMENVGKKSELVLFSENTRPSLEKHLAKPTMKPDDFLELRHIVKEPNNPIACNEQTNMGTAEDAPHSVPINTINHCQITKLPLGIFPPKLPNRRKSALSNVDDICTRSQERKEAQDSESSLLIKKLSDKITQNLSPSHYIGEELLPPCLEEMDSNESLSCEVFEKPCDVLSGQEITDNEGHLFEVFETNGRQKRAWNQDDEELQKEKKLKVDEGWETMAEFKQPLSSTVVTHSHIETNDGKTVPDLIATNLEKTQSSTSSSLDSLKADIDFSIQRNSEMETQLLMDNICGQNLQEKLQEGVITVREFFTLLQVHVLIQKPRQSQLPPKYAVNKPPTLEDAIRSQYIYRPMLQAYDEDCHILSETMEELKLHVNGQDKLLVNVHKSLWEVMKTCSDEELKGFGAELNKMKSCFTKKSKVLAHRGKAKLYGTLVQNAQLQREKLQSRLAKVDELIKKMDSSLHALEKETADLEKSELDVKVSIAKYESKLKDAERELESCKAQEEELQREHSILRDQKQERTSEISHLQEDANRYQELMKKYNFSEWVIKEWNDHKAVFTFLYDSIELTVLFGCHVDDATFSKTFCRKIAGVNFESLLDEEKALPSSKLVQRLIFQFIKSQKWQETCSTLHNLYQMLHDISLVVSRCQHLGEEIKFLDRWGGKFNLLKTEVNDTNSIASAKFEVELSLTASYPASPMTFTVQKYTGNIGQEEISVVLSSVPVGANYLKRMVNQIHHLLQCPSTSHKQQR